MADLTACPVLPDEAIEGVVECGAVAASCSCSLAAGHSVPHACGLFGCGGQWTGSPDADFEVIQWPGMRI